MATNNNSNRYPSEKGRFFKGKTFILLVGLLLGAGIMVAVYKTSVYFSSDESCMMCHVHPHAEDSWKLSKHVNTEAALKHIAWLVTFRLKTTPGIIIRLKPNWD